MRRSLSRLQSNFDRLGVRLAVVLAVALLPLMIVSIVRSQSVVNEALARSQAALVGETLRAVDSEIIIIERAKAVAQSLSRTIIHQLADPERCNRMMRDILKDTSFSFAGFYYTNGDVPCSSAPEPFSFGMSANLKTQIADPSPTVLVNEDAPASGTSVAYASYPVFTEGGSLFGFTSVSVPHKELRDVEDVISGATFLTLNASGTILTAPGRLEDAELLLPALTKGENLINQSTSFHDTGLDGVDRLYALVPVVEGELYALSTWPLENEIGGGFYLKNPALFPFLMWVASLGVAWFAVSIFVTRHVVRLRQAMQGFAASRKITTTDEFIFAPGDLREVADTFIGMTDKILHDEAQIEDALRQKDILLREVHHRTKNNLQLIASIMSMQMRQSRSKEVRHLMQGLHDRVNSLATIHRSLYQTSGQVDISMHEHLDTIVRQVVRMTATRDRSIGLKTDFADIHLNPDQAVPLSLFVTEAMTNALKYIGSPDNKEPCLNVTLSLPKADWAEVTILNSVPATIVAPDPATSSGLGSELMEAFAMQLSGTLTAGLVGDTFRVHLTFPVEPLTAKH
ncbi:MAG: sensor histidine kinase [Sulfitobacter sp.]